MKLKEFFAVVSGSNKFSISETEAPLCAMDFWHKYGGKPEWDADIASVKLIPRSKESNGLWYDDVICLIMLKK